jgi:hypothetical protein
MVPEPRIQPRTTAKAVKMETDTRVYTFGLPVLSDDAAVSWKLKTLSKDVNMQLLKRQEDKAGRYQSGQTTPMMMAIKQQTGRQTGVTASMTTSITQAMHHSWSLLVTSQLLGPPVTRTGTRRSTSPGALL